MGSIYQIFALLPDSGELLTQRWLLTSVNSNCRYPLQLAGRPTTSPLSDFTTRCSHRLLVQLASCHRKGTIRAEVEDTPQFTRRTLWTDAIRPLLLSSSSWSIFTDASWRAIHPIPVEAVFGIQGSHTGRGALFLSADHPDWCSDTLAILFEIPPTLHALGGSALVAELLAIHTGLHLLHALQLRGTVYSSRKSTAPGLPESYSRRPERLWYPLAATISRSRSPFNGSKATRNAQTRHTPPGLDTSGVSILLTAEPKIGTSARYRSRRFPSSGPMSSR